MDSGMILAEDVERLLPDAGAALIHLSRWLGTGNHVRQAFTRRQPRAPENAVSPVPRSWTVPDTRQHRPPSYVLRGILGMQLVTYTQPLCGLRRSLSAPSCSPHKSFGCSENCPTPRCCRAV